MRYKDIELEALGHASFRLKGKKIKVYIDPYKIHDDDEADYIFITHEHYDHCSPEDINRITTGKTLVIAPRSAAQKLKGNVRVVEAGMKTVTEEISYQVVEAYNTDKPFHPRGLGVGYVIEVDGVRLYHAGDTDIVPEMEELENIDIALVPVSGTYVMNPEEAAEAVDMIKPKIAVPMHYGAIVGNLTDAEIFSEQTDVKVEILSKKTCKPGECEAKPD